MKKAIVVVSFGTSNKRALENSIEKIENEIGLEFKEYDIYRAFTAHRIIEKLYKETGERIGKPDEILDQLYDSGYEEVLVQPLHIIPGEEYDYIKYIITRFKDKFNSLKLGRPIFHYSQDYIDFVESIKDVLDTNNNVILFGHGTEHIAGAAYGCLQTVLQDLGYSHCYVGTVEGYPSIQNVVQRLKSNKINNVLLMPLMVVAGDHVLNDMASDEEESWKSILESNGIKVSLLLKGLGERESFQQLYVERIKDLITDRYEGIGESKKVIEYEKSNNFVKL